MHTQLPTERMEQLIATAVRRGRRQHTLRRVTSGAAALVVVAAMAAGGSILLKYGGPGPDPSEATPAATPDTSSQPTQTPSTTPSASPSNSAPATTTPAGTSAPLPDPNATGDFSTAYTDEEQELILQHLSTTLEGRDPAGFTAVVARTTWVDGLAALSPDVEITGADDTPAFTLRVSGPFGETTFANRGGGSTTVDVVGAFSLFGTDGKGYTGGRLQQAPDAPTPTMPPVNPSYERDAAIIDLQRVELPPFSTEPPALSDEDQAIADELLATFQDLLPTGVEITEVLNSSPDGVVVTLNDGHGNTRAMIALWHLTPGAGSCTGPECTAVPVADGTVYVDDTFGSAEAPTRFYTYRRSDDAAIYFTMNMLPQENEQFGPDLTLPMTEEQVIPLLTDPAWTPFLDIKKAEPPR